MSNFMNSIPGGPDTQIAQEAGNPEYVGLSPDQVGASQSAYEASIARGRGGYRFQENAPQSASQEPQTAPKPQDADNWSPYPEDNGERVTRTIQLPSGKKQKISIPPSWDYEDVEYWLIEQGVPGFKPNGSVIDRLFYGGKQTMNIIDNIGNYAKSFFPSLATEFVMDQNGIHIETYLDKYGEDFDELDRQQKRERIDAVDAQNLRLEYPEIHPNNLGAAGVVGGLGTAIGDPPAWLPVTKAFQGANTAWKVTKASSKAGAAYGAVWGGSNVLADKGAPTTLEEIGQAAPEVIEPAITGAIAAPILGVPLWKAGQLIRGAVSKPSLNNEVKIAKFSQQAYWPTVWSHQLAGKTAGQAQALARKKFHLSIDDEWRMLKALENKVSPEWPLANSSKWPKPSSVKDNLSATNNSGMGLWSPAVNAKDAGRRFGEASARHWGDPILRSRYMEHADEYIRPIVGEIRDISPRVARRLLDYDGDVLYGVQQYHQILHPFYKGTNNLKKIATEKEYMQWTDAMLNGDFVKGRDLWRLKGLSSKHFDDMRNALLKLRKEQEAAGIDTSGFIDNWFPRAVKDVAGLKALAGRKPQLFGGLTEHLRKAEKKLDRSLTEAEEIHLINKWMRGTIGKDKYKTTGGLKKRTIKKVTPEMQPFYHDVATSLELRMQEIVTKVNRNKFYGVDNVVTKARGVENTSKSIGKMVKEAGITGDDAVKLRSLLESRFVLGEQTGKTYMNNLRQGTGALMLGNPISAIRNIGDIASIGSSQGYWNAITSAFSRRHPEVNQKIFGYMNEMFAELDMHGTSAAVKKISNRLYRLGFRQVDGYMKGTFLRAALKNTMNATKTPKSRVEFIKKYSNIYTPDEMTEILKNISEKKVTDIVRQHVNAEVMGIQPISRSMMPKKWLDHPDGRLWYQYRTFGLGQLEFMSRGPMRQLFGKNRSLDPTVQRKAARQLAVYLALAGVTNTGITELQKALTRRDTQDFDDLPDDVFWQAMGNFGLFDRYGIEKAAEEGDPAKFLASFAPPSLTLGGTVVFQTASALMQEQEPSEAGYNIFKKTGLGRNYDFWFGEGAKEWNEKNAERELKNNSPWSK